MVNINCTPTTAMTDELGVDAPILSYDLPSNLLNWTYSGTANPLSWFLEYSTDGGASWNTYESVSASESSLAAGDPDLYRITGRTSGVAVTPTSNAVEAIAPQLLIPDNEGEPGLIFTWNKDAPDSWKVQFSPDNVAPYTDFSDCLFQPSGDGPIGLGSDNEAAIIAGAGWYRIVAIGGLFDGFPSPGVIVTDI